MISIRDLHFQYPGDSGFMLHIPKLSIQSGEKVAIVGPSGSGKTTLISLISGMLRPGSGEITVSDVEVSSANDDALREFRISKIGFVFQEFDLLEYLNVRENILLPFFINPVMTINSEVDDCASGLAEQFGLQGKLFRLPSELSQGERQRVAICRALVTQPLIIIADEPTANLDASTAKVAMDILLENVRIQGKTLLMITHDRTLFPCFDQVIDVGQFRKAEQK